VRGSGCPSPLPRHGPRSQRARAAGQRCRALPAECGRQRSHPDPRLTTCSLSSLPDRKPWFLCPRRGRLSQPGQELESVRLCVPRGIATNAGDTGHGQNHTSVFPLCPHSSDIPHHIFLGRRAATAAPRRGVGRHIARRRTGPSPGFSASCLISARETGPLLTPAACALADPTAYASSRVDELKVKYVPAEHSGGKRLCHSAVALTRNLRYNTSLLCPVPCLTANMIFGVMQQAFNYGRHGLNGICVTGASGADVSRLQETEVLASKLPLLILQK